MFGFLLSYPPHNYSFLVYQLVKKCHQKAAKIAKEYEAFLKLKKWIAANYMTAIKHHHGTNIPLKGETIVWMNIRTSSQITKKKQSKASNKSRREPLSYQLKAAQKDQSQKQQSELMKARKIHLCIILNNNPKKFSGRQNIDIILWKTSLHV